jgi:hypothetical protein
MSEESSAPAHTTVADGGLSSVPLTHVGIDRHGHTKVCWAGAFGTARRVLPYGTFEQACALAAQHLADGTAACTCAVKRSGRGGPRKR